MKTRRAAAAALILCALGSSGAWAEEDRRGDPFEQTFEVEPDVRVDVEIMSGKIELRGIDANEVRVHAKGQLRVDGSRRRVSLRAPSAGWRPVGAPGRGRSRDRTAAQEPHHGAHDQRRDQGRRTSRASSTCTRRTARSR